MRLGKAKDWIRLLLVGMIILAALPVVFAELIISHTNPINDTDTFVRNCNGCETANYGDSNLFVIARNVGGEDWTDRAILNISHVLDAIPPTATITSVNFEAEVGGICDDFTEVMYLYPMIIDYDQHKVSWNGLTNTDAHLQACTPYTTSPGTKFGGGLNMTDYNGSWLIGSGACTALTGRQNFTLDSTWYQNSLQNPSLPGRGTFMMRGDDAFECDGTDRRRYWTSDYATVADRPTVYVAYELAEQTAEFVAPTPTDALKTNVLNDTINVTCTLNGEPRILFGKFSSGFNSSNVVAGAGANQSAMWAINSSVVDTTGTYYYQGICGDNFGNDTIVNTTVRSWSFDNATPLLILNGNNEWNVFNLSNNDFYDSDFRFNITFVDDIDLFGFEINVTHPNGTQYFSVLNTTLNGTVESYEKLIDISSWPSGVTYDISVQVADSHTANIIPKYSVKKANKKLEFDTDKNINLVVESDDDAAVDAFKKEDRYEWSWNFTDGQEKKRVFHFRSDHVIIYRPQSRFKAHFVVWGDGGGNWIDFEGVDSTYTVTKVSDYHYKIEFDKIKDKVKFESIGGLNERTDYYTWYYGQYSGTADDVLGGFSASIRLNVSKGANVQDINAYLTYNGTVQGSPTKVVSADYITFTNSVSTTAFSSDKNVSFFWTFNVTQTDATSFVNTLYSNHSVSVWGIDDCSYYNVSAFQFNVRNELDLTAVTANVTFLFDDYSIIGMPGVTRDYSVVRYNSDTFNFCKSSSALNFTGAMTHDMEAAGFLDRTFENVNVTYDGTFTGFMLGSGEDTIEVLYVLIDGSLARVEGATMTFSLLLNGTQVPVISGVSDVSGQVLVTQDRNRQYFVTVTHPNFPTKTFTLQPVLATYTIKLQEGGTYLFSNQYQGVRYKISPTGNVFPADGRLNFTFTIEGYDLQYYGINFTRHNFVCVPASCEVRGTSANGEALQIAIIGNSTGRFYTNLFFKRVGGQHININEWPNDFVIAYQATRSVVQLVENLKANLSPNTLIVLATFFNVAMILTASAIGLVGTPLLVIAVLMNIFMSLPMIALIHPAVGLLFSIIGFIIYIVTSVK